MVEKIICFIVQTMVGVEKGYGKMTVPVSNKIYSIFLKESRSCKRELYKQVLRLFCALLPRLHYLFANGNVHFCSLMANNLLQLNNDISELLHSRNGCEYLVIDTDSKLTEINFICDKGNLNILHLNIHGAMKNLDNLIFLLNEL